VRGGYEDRPKIVRGMLDAYWWFFPPRPGLEIAVKFVWRRSLEKPSSGRKSNSVPFSGAFFLREPDSSRSRRHARESTSRHFVCVSARRSRLVTPPSRETRPPQAESRRSRSPRPPPRSARSPRARLAERLAPRPARLPDGPRPPCPTRTLPAGGETARGTCACTSSGTRSGRWTTPRSTSA
jgi:hypothetical protein